MIIMQDMAGPSLPGRRSYQTLDDLDVPALDEVQRAPELLPAVKRPVEWLGPRVLAAPWWRVT
jgi:hypothetical protein